MTDDIFQVKWYCRTGVCASRCVPSVTDNSNHLPLNAPCLQGILLHSACVLDQLRHTQRRPQPGFISGACGPALNRARFAANLRDQDPACARSSSLLQRPSSTLLELSIPLPYRLSKCPNSPRDLGLAASLRQPRRFHPPLVECFKDLCELACSACRSCPAAPGNKLQYSTLKPKPSSPL